MISQIQTSFERLDSFIINYFKDDQSLLNEAKELFSELIDSNRDLEKVKNIEQLLYILRRKGFYTEEEFTVFKIFTKIIHDTNFASQVEGHQKLLANVNFQPKNHYAELRRKQNGTQSSSSSSASSIPFGEKRNEIFKIIAEEISPAEFPTLSRYLNFPNNEIKEIELKHRSSGTRTMVLLDLYETKKTSIKPLLSALSLMGRSDIRRKIENL